MQNSQTDLESEALKARVLSQNSTFKAAFSATMGFYAAQFVATLLGLVVMATVVVIGYMILK